MSMFFETLGWICSILVLIGFVINSRGYLKTALWIWIVSDALWIVYDIYIDNPQHILMAVGILIINITGLIRIRKKELSDEADSM
jgi:hypothetical protein